MKQKSSYYQTYQSIKYIYYQKFSKNLNQNHWVSVIINPGCPQFKAFCESGWYASAMSHWFVLLYTTRANSEKSAPSTAKTFVLNYIPRTRRSHEPQSEKATSAFASVGRADIADIVCKCSTHSRPLFCFKTIMEYCNIARRNYTKSPSWYTFGWNCFPKLKSTSNGWKAIFQPGKLVVVLRVVLAN